ncbi:carotenoid ester lipase precursor [Lactarius quietus]|nr:carotenoid ester lipase precursor [Lactarius quietus]
MPFLRVSFLAICATASTVLATPPPIPSASPIVTLDKGEFIGTTANGINKFLGIPFAQPPVGDLRFRLPQAPGAYDGKYNATAFGLSCPQQSDNPVLPNGLPNATLEYLEAVSQAKLSVGEDCLTVNVVAPANATPRSKLPVVVWIYGGGFDDGASANFDGTVIVNRSIALEQPVVYVSLNYRLAAFGFLASQEVKDARIGNLGLWDQRLALHWVQKYICEFGGDPSKVTIWGQSAGAISISLQMLANGGNTEGLFRAAFMQSGSPLPVGDLTTGQQYYDFLVERTNCSGSSDTLECLRTAPYEELMDAVNLTPSLYSYQSLAFTWQPYVDGVFLVDRPQKLIQQGKVARIPFISGECDDEGTLFSLPQTNVTTDAELRAYLTEFFLINVTDAELDKVLRLYPQDPTQGSPFDTGTQNAFTPEFKRIAALLGDLVLQAPRRWFLDNVSGKQNTWSYLNKRLKSLPVLGSAHASDVRIIYGGQDLTDYLIRFVTNLNPNGGSDAQWPPYTASLPQLLTLYDSPVPTNVTLDTYRAEGMEFLTSITFRHSV